MTSNRIKVLNLANLLSFGKSHNSVKNQDCNTSLCWVITNGWMFMTFVLVLLTLNLGLLSYAEINVIDNGASTEATTEAGTIDLGPDTKWVRDVEVVQGTLNKKTTIVVHVINVITPGTLDVDLTFNGKYTPIATINGLNFNGTSGSFIVEPASYVLTIRSISNSNTGYVASITYPEREVPLDVPLGYQEVITYGEESDLLWYIYLGLTLAIFIAEFILYRKGKISITK